jgi:hypothetical protein
MGSIIASGFGTTGTPLSVNPNAGEVIVIGCAYNDAANNIIAAAAHSGVDRFRVISWGTQGASGSSSITMLVGLVIASGAANLTISGPAATQDFIYWRTSGLDWNGADCLNAPQLTNTDPLQVTWDFGARSGIYFGVYCNRAASNGPVVQDAATDHGGGANGTVIKASSKVVAASAGSITPGFNVNAALASDLASILLVPDFGFGGGPSDDRYRFRNSQFWSGTSTLGTRRSAWPDDARDFCMRDTVADNRSRLN